MRSWNATIEGRVIAKKNSKRLFVNPRTGTPVITSSASYHDWHHAAGIQLLTHRVPEPLTGKLQITIHFMLKGRIDSDMDNMMGSICDLLQDAGIIADDKQIVEAHLRKSGGFTGFATSIGLTEIE